MIRFVTGQLAEQDAEGVVIGMGGMGFLVRVSDYTRGLLPPIGGEVTLKTHLAVREDALDLYGFGDDAERVLFMQLIGVSGIGPRMALGVLSGLSVTELTQAVTQQQAGRLVELAESERLFAEPRHDYTKHLISLVPSLAGLASRADILAMGGA